MGNLFRRSKKPIKLTLKRQQSFSNSKKMCAIFDYIPVNPEELSFEKNDVLQVVAAKQSRLWWYARHERSGKLGYIPRNFVVDYHSYHIFFPVWHDIGNVDCNRKLMRSDVAIGTFLIRPCSDRKNLVLSIKYEEKQITVKNYKIMYDYYNYYIFPKDKFENPADLIQHYSESSDGLCCKLYQPYVNRERPIAQFRRVEVNRVDIEIMKRIGEGYFSEVFMAKHRLNKMTVAVKILRQSHDDRKTFMKEAKLMHRLHHDRIVRLLGVCTLPSTEPMYIITEWMENGSLLDYIKIKENRSIVKFNDMIIMLMEIAEGMSYLESKSFIHRDLRAANILVGKDRSVKVADFGLARIVEDLYVQTEENYQFPVRWMASEVLKDDKFTLKSDVWSFGILMYELVTYGRLPYPDLNNNQVAKRVRDGYTMPKPYGIKVYCPDKYFAIMQDCWNQHRERPSFADLFEIFKVWADLSSDI